VKEPLGPRFLLGVWSAPVSLQVVAHLRVLRMLLQVPRPHANRVNACGLIGLRFTFQPLQFGCRVLELFL
jgi:hypothetical protein